MYHKLTPDSDGYSGRYTGLDSTRQKSHGNLFPRLEAAPVIGWDSLMFVFQASFKTLKEVNDVYVVYVHITWWLLNHSKIQENPQQNLNQA